MFRVCIDSSGKFLLPMVAALLVSGCATFVDGLAAIGGEGGTIARSDELTPTAERARKIAVGRPATVWETTVAHEAADLIQFIDDERVLVGNLEVGAYLGVPDFKHLTLYHARSGKKLWDAERERLFRGEYSVIALKPLIVVLGRNDSSVLVSGLDPATGARRWHAAFKSALAHGISSDLSRIFVLTAEDSKRQLAAIDLGSGRQLWSRDVPAENFGKDQRPTLLVDERGPCLLARKLLRFDAGDGRVLWTFDAEPSGAATNNAMVVPGGVLVWSADAVMLIDPNSGRAHWRHTVANGGIKIASPLRDRLFLVVSPDTANIASGPPPTDKVQAFDMRSGRQLWSRDVGGSVVSQLALERDVLLLSLEEAVLGIDAGSGAVQFRNTLSAAFRSASPTDYVPSGQPDLLHVRDGKFYLSRESVGVIAYSLPHGRQLWRHGNYALSSRDYAYSKPTRAQRLKSTLALHGRPVPVHPADLSHLYAAQPNFHLQTLQRQESALSLERSSALARGDIGKASWISRELEINAQMQSFNQGMASAQQILAAGVAASQAIAAALQNEALNGAVTRLTMEIHHAGRLHREAFQGRYYLRPYIDGWDGKVLGVTIVDLDTGRRHDLTVSPLIAAVSENGVDAPQIRLGPDGKSLFTVGVGLKPDLYQPYVAWKVRLPRPSLLAYDLSRVPFVEQNVDIERRMARADKSPPTRAQELIDAAKVGNLVKVRRLLDAGVDVNARSIHGYTALMIAADAGNERLAQLLLRRGANAKITAVGRGALDFTQSESIRKLLTDAGAVATTTGVAK